MHLMNWKAFLFAVICCVGLTLNAAIRLSLLDETAPFKAVFVSNAEMLSHTEPLVGTLEVTAPSTLDVEIPDLQERFRGFTFVEDFAVGRTEAAGKAQKRWRFRLTPSAEGPWALRPFVLKAKNLRTGESTSYLTQLVTFPAPLALPPATGEPEVNLSPEWVAPGWQTIGVWVLWALLAVGAIVAAIPLIHRIRRTLHERTLSPEARAQLELDRLLAENLLAQGQFKRFYYGLTGVVRRYFERGYALRATRQTTQEFLSVIANDARVSAAERAALEQFLNAADAIKFAGIAATAVEAESATNHVRSLIAEAAEHRQQIATSETSKA
jgi:hypothetical protein